MKVLTHRFLAQITIEAYSAFAINSGKVGLQNDNMVAKDGNGLPYLPGTSIAGVLRHAIDKALENELFGTSGTGNSKAGESKDGFGSRLIISPGLLVGKEGKVVEGLLAIDFEDPFYSLFRALPLRDHVKINSSGSAEKGAKYDEELVFKGTRFVFEIELKGVKEDQNSWEQLLGLLETPDFRLGAGTRKGHGEFKIIHERSTQRVFDLSQTSDLTAYLSKTVSLNLPIPNGVKLNTGKGQSLKGWKKYELQLKAKDFFIFGAGFGDGDVDHITKREKIISWVNHCPKISDEEFILIPATSIKGALAHRVRFNFSKNIDDYIESPKDVYRPYATVDEEKILTELKTIASLENLELYTSDDVFTELESKIRDFDPFKSQSWISFENQLKDEAAVILKIGDQSEESNLAIKTLFGFANNHSQEEQKSSGKGNVIIQDVYLTYKKENDKVFNHVKIDRFTGGAIDGALFQEKAFYGKDQPIDLDIFVKKEALEDPKIKKAWEDTLEDLIQGGIPLGGMTTKGHGFFTGTKKEN
ncbi:RAMP superfamily CRISPR-associated protein [Belliella kenyensis]|uniref:RAMP superfamily CRISPR-associated protein n=1 Tax=Belliella kenyensis TaxID=1472724 RepID=A0ABV8EQ60_9BACT|nr:RAMP superfamily CRISPR-associated protein [Belliella kenyensis]MCH7402136.1 RAMP superfamily CRISPR-associated protein [Belliella kenyensis]MDN3601651.1 RAMP superfamily CRISPR-associated protein [Belliella kenyensis]